MSNATDRIRNGRIATVIGQVERSEEVDLVKLGLLQSLDTVQEGREQLADAIERNDAADDKAIEFLRSLN